MRALYDIVYSFHCRSRLASTTTVATTHTKSLAYCQVHEICQPCHWKDFRYCFHAVAIIEISYRFVQSAAQMECRQCRRFLGVRMEILRCQTFYALHVGRQQ